MSMLSRFASLAAPAAGIQYVGGNTQTVPNSTTATVSLTSLTGGIASSAAAGDLVIVYYGVGYASGAIVGTVSTAGYTQVALLTATDTASAQLSVAYKRMGSTPDTTVGLNAPNNSGANATGAVVVHVWRGVDSVLPFSTAATTDTGTNSVLCNPPSITPVTDGAVIVSGGAGGHNVNTGIAYTYSSSDLSNFVTVGSAFGGSTRQATVGVGSKAWTSGAFDPAAFTFSGTDSANYCWCAVTMALLPAQTNQSGPFAIAQASTQTASSSTLVINKPAGTREGDLMVACMAASTNVTWTGDTGWTEVADQGANPSTRIAYKVAGASEGASYTFTASNTVNVSGTIVTYRNAAYDAVGSITSGAATLAVGSVTASAAFSRILSTVARGASGITITGPATMETIAIDNDATAPSRLVEQDASLSPAGASGTRSFVMGSGTAVSGALVAIKPAASYTKYANYITNNSASTNANTTVSVNTPSCVPGNLLLFVATAADNGTNVITFSTPAGWTLLTGASTANLSYQPGMYIFYRVADGTEAASYTATASNSCSLAACIVALAGVDASTLTAGTTATGSATTSITATGVTATANGILLYFGAQSNSNNEVTFTPPSGMTEAADVPTSAGGAQARLSLEVAYQEGLSAGATGSKTATASSSLGTPRYRAILVTVGAK